MECLAYHIRAMDAAAAREETWRRTDRSHVPGGIVMELMPLHPKLVHLPIALAVLMPFVSFGLAAAWWTGFLPRRAWLVAVALQAVLVVGALASLRTGDADEERVERVVAERFIDQHEEAAEAFTWAAGAVLLLALVPLALRDDRTARRVAAAAVLGTVVVTGLGYRVGEAGGRLVYRHGAAVAWSGGAAARAGGLLAHH
jgi:uncharacterized membrane protein